jgi:SPP1 family predicted phage head-tail adaptor
MQDAGKRDRRITIQKPGTDLDSYGQVVADGWTDVATVWANIRPVSGREKLRAGAVESTLSHTVSVLYQSKLMPPLIADAWRIKFGPRLFNIVSAYSPNESREDIIFSCEEGSLDGN